MSGLTSDLVSEDAGVEPARRNWWLLFTSPRAGVVIAASAFLIAFGTGFLRARSVMTAVPAEPVAADSAPAASGRPPQGPKRESVVPAASPHALQWPLWEYKLQQPLQAREAPLTPVSWRLLGAVLDQGQWKIIVMHQGKEAPEFFKVGEKLPGGYLIREITQDDVTLVSGRRELILAYIGSR